MISFIKRKPTVVSSTPFSDFIRNARSEDKKRVYSAVLKKASESQVAVIERVRRQKAP